MIEWETTRGHPLGPFTDRETFTRVRQPADDPAPRRVPSALDVSVQATILTLLRDLTGEFGSTVMFVGEAFAVVRSIADRVIVMRSGEFCEAADTETLFANPLNSYTHKLLTSVPSIPIALQR